MAGESLLVFSRQDQEEQVADLEPQSSVQVQQPVCKMCSEASWEKYLLKARNTHKV